MQTKKLYLLIFSVMILPLLACNSLLPFGLGSSPATAADIPVYPGATGQAAGESAMGDTLANNMEQDAAIKQALGAMGGGGKLEQKGFQLPSEATWDEVKSFYSKELEAAGWTSGVGGIASSFIDVNAVMEAANEGNDLFQTALWSKDKQTLTIVMVTDPTDETSKQLIFSLSGQ
jgi:hypothetical protein